MTYLKLKWWSLFSTNFSRRDNQVHGRLSRQTIHKQNNQNEIGQDFCKKWTNTLRTDCFSKDIYCKWTDTVQNSIKFFGWSKNIICGRTSTVVSALFLLLLGRCLLTAGPKELTLALEALQASQAVPATKPLSHCLGPIGPGLLLLKSLRKLYSSSVGSTLIKNFGETNRLH
jgi:hypothetical protein